MTANNPLWGEDWPDVRALWPLEPSVDHLNHGSYGAVPTPVLDEQQSWRQRMEENPVRFFGRELPDALEEARLEVARFLGAEENALVLVPNATTAMSTVLSALRLQPADDLLVTDHAYGAVGYAAERFASRAGARLVSATLPLDGSDDETERAVLAALTDRTRLAIIEEITSPTARRLPVARLVAGLRGRGVRVLVDGAHAPGMLPVDLAALGADYWTGNLHKWCCAPRGTGVLVVAGDRRADLDPLVASWGQPRGFPESFATPGTDDYTAWLAAPRALRLMSSLGWDRVRAHNLALVDAAQQRLAAALGLGSADLPLNSAEVSMRLVPLPAGLAASYDTAAQLQASISERIGVEVAVTTWRGRGFVRISAQVYNAPGDYDRLCAALPALL